MREEFEDYARAIGIILVVFGHVLRGLVSAGIVHTGHWLTRLDYPIYTFHMPLFFVLSGLHVEQSLRRGRKRFIETKVETIIYPYLLWSVLQGLVQWLAAGNANHQIELRDLLTILWIPIGQFWFLYALFLCQFFVCLTTTQCAKLIPAALLAYAVGSIFSFGVFTTAMKFFLFFAAGIVLANSLRSIVSRAATLPRVAVTLIALSIAIYFAHKLGAYDSFWALPAAVLGILLVFEIAMLMTRFGHLRVFKVLGTASMPIYLAHILGGSGVRIALIHLHVINVYAQLFFGVLGGLIFPLVLYFVATRMRLAKWLGFPGSRTPASGSPKSAGAFS